MRVRRCYALPSSKYVLITDRQSVGNDTLKKSSVIVLAKNKE